MCVVERVIRCQNVSPTRLPALIKGCCVPVCACVYVCAYVRESDMVPECFSNSPSSTDKGVLFGERERESIRECCWRDRERVCS